MWKAVSTTAAATLGLAAVLALACGLAAHVGYGYGAEGFDGAGEAESKPPETETETGTRTRTETETETGTKSKSKSKSTEKDAETDADTAKTTLLLLTYENDAGNANSAFFLQQLRQWGFAHANVGVGERWTGWSGRLQKYLRFLRGLEDDSRFVLVTDARDVLLNNASSEEFLRKARAVYDERLLVSTERYCCDTGAAHDDFYVSAKIGDAEANAGLTHTEVYKNFMRAQAYQLDPGYKSDLYYLNFGLMFGRARDFVRVFERMQMRPGLDDQLLLHKVWFENPDLVRPDIHHALLSTAGSGGRECYYAWDATARRFRCTATGEYPCLLHCAGNFWSCYHMLRARLDPQQTSPQ